MFNEFEAFENDDDRGNAITEVHCRLRMRLATDRLLTRESIDWAHDRVRADEHAGITADGAFAVLELKVRMTHLAGQHAALSRAFEELQPKSRGDGEDQVQQAFFELLRRIEAHPDWVCENGRPSVAAARADLGKRLRNRGKDALKRQARFVDHASSRDLGIFGIEERDLLELVSHDAFDSFVRGQLTKADLPKWDRFCRWACDGIGQRQLADEAGMSHAAVRKESERLRAMLLPIAVAWRRACTGRLVSSGDEEGQASVAALARTG